MSNTAGIIGLFLGLLIAGALIIRIFIYRGFRKKTTELEQAMSDQAQKEKVFEERVSTEVARGIYQEKKQLFGQWDDFHDARNKASRALPRIVDSAYKFKVKTLLSGTTLNNWQSKYDQLRKEKEAYTAISEKITFLELEDSQYGSDDWQQFCRANNLAPSMSRRGNCWDNAVAESFISSLKKERIRKRIYKTRDLAQADIFDYIEVFYNRSRRHSYLGGVSPEAFEQDSS